MSYKDNQKHPHRKEIMRLRRIIQLDRKNHKDYRPYLHPGKYNGKDLRKIRQKHGVGTVRNPAVAKQMNDMWDMAARKRDWYEQKS